MQPPKIEIGCRRTKLAAANFTAFQAAPLKFNVIKLSVRSSGLFFIIRLIKRRICTPALYHMSRKDHPYLLHERHLRPRFLTASRNVYAKLSLWGPRTHFRAQLAFPFMTSRCCNRVFDPACAQDLHSIHKGFKFLVAQL